MTARCYYLSKGQNVLHVVRCGVLALTLKAPAEKAILKLRNFCKRYANISNKLAIKGYIFQQYLIIEMEKGNEFSENSPIAELDAPNGYYWNDKHINAPLCVGEHVFNEYISNFQLSNWLYQTIHKLFHAQLWNLMETLVNCRCLNWKQCESNSTLSPLLVGPECCRCLTRKNEYQSVIWKQIN